MLMFKREALFLAITDYQMNPKSNMQRAVRYITHSIPE